MVLPHRMVIGSVMFLMTAGTLGAGAAPPGSAPSGQGSPAPVSRTAGPGAAQSAPPGAGRVVSSPDCVRPVQPGPATRPPGAVTVTGRLDLAVAAHPAGTTFWVTPGVHVLGSGEYDQVQPKSGDRIIGAPGAILDGQRRNHYAFAGHATGVRISHLTVRNFGTSITDDFNEGAVNHDAGHGWRMRALRVLNNAGAGVFLGSGNVLSRSCLAGNGQYGFSAYEEAGVRNVRLIGNEIAGNDTARWEERQSGCGCTGGGKFWATRNAVIRANVVHDNIGVGIWADTNNTGFLISHNTFSGNADAGLVYETSYNARIVHNTFSRNALIGGPKDPGFPHPALYISESGADSRAGRRYGRTLEVAHNRFRDNWSGVVLWENADRFAGSPANTSTGISTLVSPKATVAACATPGRVAETPLVDDCRWKTQHVRVRHNRFVFSAARVGHGCAARNGCGYNGLFSNYGTYPSWSPYQGTVVEDHITFDQDNRFADNRYVGRWRLMAHEQGQVVGWAGWRAAPYRQDRGSTRSG